MHETDSLFSRKENQTEEILTDVKSYKTVDQPFGKAEECGCGLCG